MPLTRLIVFDLHSNIFFLMTTNKTDGAEAQCPDICLPVPFTTIFGPEIV